MKRILLLLPVFIFAMTMSAQTFKTIKVGESFSTVWYNDSPAVIGGNAIAVRFNYGGTATVYGVQPGYATYCAYKSSSENPAYSVHVLDVIPSEVELLVGGNYTYSPVVNSNAYSYSSFTWASDNTAVATVNANGNVSAVAPGKATITCTANGDNSFSSVVYVCTQLAQQVKLNTNNLDLSIGNTTQLTATISPVNTTNKAVKWLSSNENIAQVDDEGNVTAVGAGYCSIYVKADDGSGKFDKCLIHVNGPATARGDINGDGAVNLSDAKMVVDIFVGNE